MTETAEAEFPALFCHQTRADWGVGVLSGERDGKRSYLFESGEERVMGKGALDMMSKLTSLSADQQSTLARLTALVARRRGLSDSPTTSSILLLDQVATLRRAFPRGLVDPAWQSQRRAARAREALVPRAQELLSLKSLDAQLKAQQFDAVWAAATQVLDATGWLPSDQLKPVTALGVALLAGALRELLYGSAALEYRIDRFSVAFETAFRRAPRWETTTGLLALVFPDGQVLVELASFRKQLKLIGAKGPLPQRPSGAGYARCLNAARLVANKLTEQGEVPRDLLDVHDFVRFTLTPRAKVSKKKSPSAEADVSPAGKARWNLQMLRRWTGFKSKSTRPSRG